MTEYLSPLSPQSTYPLEIVVVVTGLCRPTYDRNNYFLVISSSKYLNPSSSRQTFPLLLGVFSSKNSQQSTSLLWFSHSIYFRSDALVRWLTTKSDVPFRVKSPKFNRSTGWSSSKTLDYPSRQSHFQYTLVPNPKSRNLVGWCDQFNNNNC